MATASKTTARYRVRKPAPKKAPAPRKPAARKPAARSPQRTRRRRLDLPSWSDLSSAEQRAPRARATLLDGIPTRRLALWIGALAAAFTLYVGHVHATQNLLAEVEQARRENLRLHLKHNRLKGDFDRATGPAVIYKRAQELGLEEGIAYGPVIHLDAAPAR